MQQPVRKRELRTSTVNIMERVRGKDPHRRNFNEKLEPSKEKKEITPENELAAGYRLYRMHRWRLDRMNSNARDSDVIDVERAKMREFLRQQQEGDEMTLSDLREQILNEYMKRLRQIIEAETFWRGQPDFANGRFELFMQVCEMEKRKDLCVTQAEVQKEWNRENDLRKEQERRERQKHQLMQHRIACRKLQKLEPFELEAGSSPYRSTVQKTTISPSRTTTQKTNITPSRTTTQKTNITPSRTTTQKTNITPSRTTTQKRDITPTRTTTQKMDITPSRTTTQKTNITPSRTTTQKTNITPSKTTTQKTNITPSRIVKGTAASSSPISDLLRVSAKPLVPSTAQRILDAKRAVKQRPMKS